MDEKNAPKPAILVERLRYRYGSQPGRVVLDDVNLAFAENDFAAVLGRNGSGKTTLLKNIVGLLRPRDGRILVRGRDSAGMGVAEIAGEIGYVMQDSDNQLFEQTVYDEAAFALKVSGKRLARGEIRDRVGEALAALGLWERRDEFPPSLARPDRVKTVFAAVLAMGARILLLDEPLAGQDRRGSREITEVLARLHRGGCTVILVTHNVRVAAEYARRLVVMDRGRVCLDGSVGETLERLREAGIAPTRIAGVSGALRGKIPVKKTAATPLEFAEMLAEIHYTSDA